MDISLGILAGGNGRRLSGRDKGLLVIDGQPQAGRLLANTSDFAETLVCCRRNPFLYQHYADRILCDVKPDTGPIAGMLALLAACETPLLAILPCDQRQLVDGWLHALQGALFAEANPSMQTGAYISDRGQFTPCCLLRRASLAQLDAIYATGERSMKGAYRQLALVTVEVDGMGWDIDEPKDLTIDGR